MPNILVSNDDGVFAPGIAALANAMLGLGNVWVVAPKSNHSISGHQRTLFRPLRATPITNLFHPDVQAFAVDGTPADCVALALKGFIEDDIDIVVSGINSGPNLGQDITYSGTVSVALEAAIYGLSAVAFSLDNRNPDASYAHCVDVVQDITRQTLANGLPEHTILNVNVPAMTIEGIEVTRQGRRDYRGELDQRHDPFGRPYYWVAGEEPGGDIEAKGTDIWAVHHNQVSVTPIHLDLTNHAFLQNLDSWEWDTTSDGGID